ncbi:MAG: S8 family serine peptidase, partial [Candidatus Electryoneaceae bacterium]|nr:S8 family serine peptidase [Candidatus Electryoneaceae bacterium]
KPEHTIVGQHERGDCITVKFVQGSDVRLREGNLVSLTGYNLTPFEDVMKRSHTIDLMRLFTRPEHLLDEERERGQIRSGKELGDLNNYYRVVLDPAQQQPEQFIDALNGLDIIEIAFPAPTPFLAEDIDPETGDFTEDQGYLYEAPGGIDAPAAWEQEGGMGETIQIIDIEGAWHFTDSTTHEDLKEAFFIAEDDMIMGWINHGDAVIGELVGQHNGYGIDGICPDAEVGGHSVSGSYPNGGWPDMPDVLNNTIAALEEGDIFLIELQGVFNNQFYSPMETWQDNYDAIETGSANGIICAEAAANGNSNLDAGVYEGRFDPENRHSGAIMVGAGAPNFGNWGPNLSRLDFSNYGQRVDLQGWGQGVTTTGYGDLFFPNADQLQWYTSTFGGTSSATPIVAGAVACLQGIYKAQNDGEVMTPQAIRDILVATGTPQSEDGLQGHIGPRPNLAPAIGLLRDPGIVYGTVTDAATDEPIQDAMVFLDVDLGAFADANLVTDVEGNWRATDIPSEISFTVTASLLGFNDSTVVELSVGENDSVEVNIAMLHPEFAVSDDNITAEIFPNETAEQTLTISNPGNGVLTWSISLEVTENEGADPWHFARSLPIDRGIGAEQLNGLAYVDGRFYIPGSFYSRPNWVYVLDREVALVDSFCQFTIARYGMMDVAWDGELLWGGEDYTLTGFTRAGERVQNFDGPFRPIQAMTYDPDSETLWFSGRSTDILGYSREGESRAQLHNPGFEIIGMNWMPRDPDGYHLYIFHLVGDHNTQTVHKMNAENGDTMFVAELASEMGGASTGSFVSTAFNPYGNSTFMTVVNVSPDHGGNRIDFYERLLAGGSWVNMESDENEGVLLPEGEEEFVLTFSSAELDTGTFEGEILVTHSALGGEVTIPVTMTVLPLGVAQDDNDVLPTEFDITSIYPNPFNSTTVIRYSLPAVDDISLGLYDIQGRLVTLLHNGVLPAGTHQAMVSGDNLSSGLYFVRLAGSSGVQIAKVTLVR